ncbi:putative regulatory protein, FmdB family [Geodermatophilus pulveris]|uniref:Putative regulatory protein, FmdB family n=1 Tax=Geodermatophilus pulveris TaxID=1564159 RepID=A0A239IR60_9ACTN|nr:zinc ribbon domain-containing protein [Geodermatophilus pulveris]SNS96041.1 putative regulatory protein, FmdB family [Geodermatophilus pulveris]
MPLYEFRCPGCGPFDLRRDMRDAPSTAPCPTCDQAAQRHYGVGVGSRPKGVLRDANRADRARVDRARTGEPVVTGPPSGRRLPGAGAHRH